MKISDDGFQAKDPLTNIPYKGPELYLKTIIFSGHFVKKYIRQWLMAWREQEFYRNGIC